MCNKRKNMYREPRYIGRDLSLQKQRKEKKKKKEAIIVHEFEILFCDRANNCQYLSKVCKFNGFLKSEKGSKC